MKKILWKGREIQNNFFLDKKCCVKFEETIVSSHVQCFSSVLMDFFQCATQIVKSLRILNSNCHGLLCIADLGPDSKASGFSSNFCKDLLDQ